MKKSQKSENKTYAVRILSSMAWMMSTLMHGMDDVNADDEQTKKKDTEFINKFLKVVDESVIPKTISRLG